MCPFLEPDAVPVNRDAAVPAMQDIRSSPQKVLAEPRTGKTVRRRQNDPHLAVYECPFNKDSGTWAIHLERQPL
jgi:hypothetical protein